MKFTLYEWKFSIHVIIRFLQISPLLFYPVIKDYFQSSFLS